jgi:hypothetical protein
VVRDGARLRRVRHRLGQHRLLGRLQAHGEGRRGGAVQVGIQFTLSFKAPGFNPWNLKRGLQVSKFADRFNLYHYIALEAELVKRATSWCETSSVPPCAVEALRSLMDGGNTCSSAGATCDAAAMETYRWAIDGPAAASMTPAVGYTVDSTAGALAGTMYDGDSGACNCSATMLPLCACASIRSPPPPPPPSMDDGRDMDMDVFGAGGIGGFIGGAAALLFAGVFGCYRCCRPKAPPPPPQQQQQQYPTGAYPAGAVQIQHTVGGCTSRMQLTHSLYSVYTVSHACLHSVYIA